MSAETKKSMFMLVVLVALAGILFVGLATASGVGYISYTKWQESQKKAAGSGITKDFGSGSQDLPWTVK